MKILAILFLFATLWNLDDGCKKKPTPEKTDDDLDKPGLTALFNSRVQFMQEYRRPFIGYELKFWRFYHAGIVVKLENGKEWLIHKVQILMFCPA